MSHIRHYTITEEPESEEHKFSIYNDDNKLIYLIHTKLVDTINVLNLTDSSGQLILKICQEIPHVHLTFKVYSKNDSENSVATIERAGFSWRHKFKIESVYGKYTIDRANGGLDHEYVIVKDEKEIGFIRRNKSNSGEFYLVNIDDTIHEQEDVFLLSFVVVLWYAQSRHYLGQNEHD